MKLRLDSLFRRPLIFAFPVLIAVLAGICRGQTATILNETFSGADRTVQNLPGSIAWHQSPASGALSVNGAALDLAVANGSRDLWAYFPVVSLQVGQALTLSLDFSFTAAPLDGFRCALCYSNGAAQPTADGSPPSGNYQGYGFFGTGGSTVATTPVKRNGPSASATGSPLEATTAGYWTTGPNSVPGPSQAGTTYTSVVRILRTGTDSAVVSVSFSGGNLNGTTVASLYDPNESFSQFDTLALHFLGSTLNGDLLITRANLSTSTPAIYMISAPASQKVATGSTVTFSALAGGTTAVTYQWQKNGANIPGATSSTLVITGATLTDAASYACVATNAGGTVASDSATLSVAANSNPGRLVNLSVNTTAGSAQIVTVGFETGGVNGGGSQTLLIRATGPALAALGVSNTLQDPTLALLSGSLVIASNDNWGTPSNNAAQVTAADTTTGAFPLTNPTSLDAAVVASLNPGGYTVQIGGNGPGSGVALAEVYDDTANYTTASPRLINLSCNDLVAAKGSLTAGFEVGGATSKTVLIRATGPALATLGVSGTMPDPQIALHATVNGIDTILAANAGWGGDPQISAVSISVYAFPLSNPASKDSVVLVTLPPGGYTAVLSSVSGTSGTALVEIYEVP